jgi:hypothetical protein
MLLNEVGEVLGQLQRAENFRFVNLVSVLHDADQAGVSDIAFTRLVEHMLTFVEQSKQAIRYSLR